MIKVDKLWWYSSLRDQDAQSLLPNFPVKPFETRPQEHHRQGHLRAVHQQQAGGDSRSGDRSSSRTGSIRSWWARRSPFTTAPTRPGTSPTGRAPTRWAGTASSTTRCSSKCTAASSITSGRTRATPTAPRLRGPQHQHRERRQPGRLVPRHHAQPGARIAQLFQGRLGRQSQLQVRRRVLQRAVRRPARTGRQGPGPERRADGLAKRRPVGSRALPVADHVAERPVDDGAVHVGHLACRRRG